MEHVSIACSQEVGSVLEIEVSPFFTGECERCGSYEEQFLCWDLESSRRVQQEYLGWFGHPWLRKCINSGTEVAGMVDWLNGKKIHDCMDFFQV